MIKFPEAIHREERLCGLARSWPRASCQNRMTANESDLIKMNRWPTHRWNMNYIDTLQCTEAASGICVHPPVHTVCFFISVLSWFIFFPSSSVCQSVRPSVCNPPSWQPACLYPPPKISRLCATKWLLSRYYPQCFIRFFWCQNSVVQVEELDTSNRMAALLIRIFLLMGKLSYNMDSTNIK